MAQRPNSCTARAHCTRTALKAPPIRLRHHKATPEGYKATPEGYTTARLQQKAALPQMPHKATPRQGCRATHEATLVVPVQLCLDLRKVQDTRLSLVNDAHGSVVTRGRFRMHV